MESRSARPSRWISLAAAIGLTAILVAVSMMTPINAYAAASDHTREDAVAYVRSLIGSKHDYDHNNGGSYDCVDIAKFYYAYLGEDVERGNGYTYTTGHLPKGWTRLYSNPQPGDVAAWGRNCGMSSYGHVAVVVSVSGSKVSVVDQSTSQQRAAKISTWNTKPTCYLRPNFRNSAPLSHVIEYNTSGGAGSFSSMTVTAGNKFTTSSTKPTKKGYVFKGWALKRIADQKWNSKKGWVSKEHVDQNGGYRLYSPGVQLTLDDSWMYGYAGGATKFRFYAIWEKVASKVYFSTNGGTGSYSTISSTYGSQFKIPAAKPTRSGYTFKGWALKRLADQKWITTKGTWVAAADVAANGGYRTYAAGTDRTLVPSWYTGCEGTHVNFRFYAQWEKASTTAQMSFSYNLNGGSGTFVAQTGNMGGTLLMPSAKPTRVGYKFKNWALKREGDGLWYSKQGNWVAQSQLSAEGGNYAYGAGTTRNLNASWVKGYTGTNYTFTFYAQWEPISAKYTFGLEGGTGSFTALNLTFGDKFSLPAAKPTKQYYTFKGWIVKRASDDKWYTTKGGWSNYDNVESNGGYKIYAPSASYSVSASWVAGYTKGDVEFRFYAYYEKNSGVFEFTFGLNGGEGTHQSTACLSGGTITLPKDKPTKSGYTFKGWVVKRIGDSNWVSMKGWVTSKNVASNGGYRYYAAGKTLTIDASWTKGYTGSVRDYRFFAQWEPATSLKAA